MVYNRLCQLFFFSKKISAGADGVPLCLCTLNLQLSHPLTIDMSVKVTLKQLLQPLRNHIKSFRTPGQLYKIPPFSARKILAGHRCMSVSIYVCLYVCFSVKVREAYTKKKSTYQTFCVFDWKKEVNATKGIQPSIWNQVNATYWIQPIALNPVNSTKWIQPS
jgi:hypothetical protein